MNNLLKGINIYLIGMMGTGKTTLGRILSEKLGYRFFDTDVLLERLAGKTIKEIFAAEGEESFRALETLVLEQLCAYTKSVIATGGGIVLRQKNWSYLHHGVIVWLDASPDLLIKRLQNDNTRPLLDVADLESKLTSLIESRKSLYQQADLHIFCEDIDTPEDISLKILEKIPSVLKTNPQL